MTKLVLGWEKDLGKLLIFSNLTCPVTWLTAEGARLEAGGGRGPAPVPARPGPLPGVADQDPDRRGERGHPRQPGGRGATSQPAPGYPRGDRQLHGRLHQDDGVRRNCHCGELSTCGSYPLKS